MVSVPQVKLVLEIFIKCVEDFIVECEGLRVVVTGKMVQ